ncbi:MAG: DUF1572 domain-containing protein [Chitinophagales bacterium]|nr:DUF1572 domain-containing protein [Chitinophagales bacterium]
MSIINQITKHFRDVHFGGNWTSVNVKDTLADISWEEAKTKVYDLNTIATLVFHMNYYVENVLKVLHGEPLNASDKLSFNVPEINNSEDWQKLVTKTLTEAELFALQLGKMDESKLLETFSDSKYCNYYKNMHGIIEHTHYHLGQISLLKKILRENKKVEL